MNFLQVFCWVAEDNEKIDFHLIVCYILLGLINVIIIKGTYI